MNVKCPYCSGQAKLVRARDLPSSELSEFSYLKQEDTEVWYCEKCSALVLARKDTKEPLGRLGNKELRAYRRVLHQRLDAIWMKRKVPRKDVYNILASKMKIPYSQCHISNFNMKQCRKAEQAIAWMEKYVGKYC